MFRRWLLYLAILAGCVIFFFAYNGWFSWLALVGVFFLPLLGLLLSLPAMILTRPRLQCAEAVTPGEPQRASLTADCPLPAPILRGKLRVTHSFSGHTQLLRPEEKLPTNHCGQLVCTGVRIRIYDYLGLFFLPVRKGPGCSMLIRPRPIAMGQLPDLERHIATAWKPKPGGGFSENHELRLYRPGDSMNQIHWKLSAKTGKYIIREAMEPRQSVLLLNLELRGTPEQLDRKLGQLLWISTQLIEQNRFHQIRVLSGSDTLHFPIRDEASLSEAMDRILCAPGAAEGASLEAIHAAWQYTPGGDADED